MYHVCVHLKFVAWLFVLEQMSIKHSHARGFNKHDANSPSAPLSEERAIFLICKIFIRLQRRKAACTSNSTRTRGPGRYFTIISSLQNISVDVLYRKSSMWFLENLHTFPEPRRLSLPSVKRR